MGRVRTHPVHPPGYGPVTVFVVAPWLPLLRILNTLLSVNFMFLPEKEKARRTSKIEKKKWRGAASRSIKFYGHVPREEICNEITTCVQIYKKVSCYATPFILFVYQMGENLSKRLF